MMKAPAIYKDCVGMSDPYVHMMRDFCTSCAPFWERVPKCPTHTNRTLTQAGFCRDCRKFYELGF